VSRTLKGFNTSTLFKSASVTNRIGPQYPQRGSNPHWAEFKSAASANWATRVMAYV
jgi:hypothetical protein